MKVRFIECDHSCGGKPIKFATPGTEGFVCTNCGATVITKWGVDPSAKAPSNEKKVRRQYF